MRSHTWMIAALATLLIGSLPAPAGAQEEEEDEFTSEFRLQDCWFVPYGKNPFFRLQPGFALRLEGEDEEEGEEIVVVTKVLHDTEVIRFRVNGHPRKVRTRVLRETEYINGELFEVSHNYYASCWPNGDVYYFGEFVEFYEDGEVVNNDGSWRVGEGGALPGIIMPGTFLLGARYHQEVAPGVAEDRAEHVAMGLDVETEAGAFSDCVGIEDTNPLDPESDGDDKQYCPGVGLTTDEELELVEFGFDVDESVDGD